MNIFKWLREGHAAKIEREKLLRYREGYQWATVAVHIDGLDRREVMAMVSPSFDNDPFDKGAEDALIFIRRAQKDRVIFAALEKLL